MSDQKKATRIDKPDPRDCFDVHELQLRILTLHSHLEALEDIRDMLTRSNTNLWALVERKDITMDHMGKTMDKQLRMLMAYKASTELGNRLN
jgi:hypothetical protein